jgi:hypothetical protein
VKTGGKQSHISVVHNHCCENLNPTIKVLVFLHGKQTQEHQEGVQRRKRMITKISNDCETTEKIWEKS